MNTSTQLKNGISKAKKKTDEAFDAASDQVDDVETSLEQRFEQAKDLVEEIRDRAEIAMRERPYLVPVAAGALGLGVGVLIGSKLSRMLVIGVAGALLNDTVRSQVARVAKDFVADLGDKLEVDAEDEDDVASSVGAS